MQVGIVTAADLENPDEGDLLLRDGQTTLTGTLADEVAQTLHARFEWWRGEWFLDEAQGTPWLDGVLGKESDEQAIRSVFTRIVTSTPGVASCDDLTVTIDAQTRLADVSFTARLRDGTVLTSTDYGPYLVSV